MERKRYGDVYKIGIMFSEIYCIHLFILCTVLHKVYFEWHSTFIHSNHPSIHLSQHSCTHIFIYTYWKKEKEFEWGMRLSHYVCILWKLFQYRACYSNSEFCIIFLFFFDCASSLLLWAFAHLLNPFRHSMLFKMPKRIKTKKKHRKIKAHIYVKKKKNSYKKHAYLYTNKTIECSKKKTTKIADLIWEEKKTYQFTPFYLGLCTETAQMAIVAIPLTNP